MYIICRASTRSDVLVPICLASMLYGNTCCHVCTSRIELLQGNAVDDDALDPLIRKRSKRQPTALSSPLLGDFIQVIKTCLPHRIFT